MSSVRASDLAEPVEQYVVRPLPIWLVSTAHSYVRRGKTAKEGIRLPYGVQHARQVGSKLTACGIGAFDWLLFWETAFPSDNTTTCHECRRVVARAENYSRGPLPPS